MGGGGGGGGGNSLVHMQTLIPTAADGLHHRYVLNSVHGHQNFGRPRYEVIAYLSYFKELLVIAMAMVDVRRTPMTEIINYLCLWPMCITAAATG